MTAVYGASGWMPGPVLDAILIVSNSGLEFSLYEPYAAFHDHLSFCKLARLTHGPQLGVASCYVPYRCS